MAGARTALAWDAAAEEKAVAAIAAFKAADPDMEALFQNAHGYAVFPEITKGGIGIGGAAGDGTVFEGGQSVGSSRMTQVTAGLQLGGQTYREVIFFEDKVALDRFKNGNVEVTAAASAVAVEAGASSTANYDDGVAIFTMATGGVMFEATIGGQEFTYEPK
jgi:lipid-binding SYLF domain-containing protein